MFGTDGIRGVANCGLLTPDNLLKIAVATSAVILKDKEHPKIVIGKDTRLSGYMVENSLTAGFVAAGSDVLLLGPMPTPAIAMLIRSMRADLGVMISASHNPYQDNGIKIFGADGFKISDELQNQIETIMANGSWLDYLASPTKLGKAKRIDDAAGRYIEFVKNTFPRKLSLSGLRVVVDCANGAAYQIAPMLLWELGAEVITIGNEPNGYNINENCGSTSPSQLVGMVKKTRADIGIALDGDADRVVMVDEKGNIIDGDKILAVIATSWNQNGTLTSDKIISTVMANMGLEKYLESINLSLVRTKVGDRYVMQAMKEYNSNLGGEQSGHIIMNDYTTTGDGIIAALQVLSVVIEQKRPVSEVCNLFEVYPQIKLNVKFNDNSPLSNPEISHYIDQVSEQVSKYARVLVRQSGTESLIRVMVEGDNNETISNIANDIVEKLNAIK